MNDSFKMYFHEWFDTQDEKIKLELAHNFSSEDIWVRKRELGILGYIANGVVTDEWENIKEDFYADGNKAIPIQAETSEESGCFQESATRVKWEKFENVWLPMPFFKLGENNKSDFGPTNWCRFKIIPIETTGRIRTYDLLLAFDTRTVFEKEDFENEDLNETPVFSNKFEKSLNFSLCNDEFKLVDYCSKAFNCEWVDQYVLKLFHNVNSLDDLKIGKPKLSYLAQYIFILRYILHLDVLNKITLYSNKNAIYGNVDLVVDIGNSRTCAVLFDDGDFTKTSPLELQDFTLPVSNGKLNKHTDSFDMRLAFRQADLGGKLGIANSGQFLYPSMIRVGKEADYLLHKATNINTGTEKTTSFSSPKRFLWDTKPQAQEWEFIQLDGESTKPIYIKGISEQLNADGSLNLEGSGSILTCYSRKALMTFAFIEILAQANMQINSFDQRKHWGNETKPREIRRIIITCPPAMSKVEQIALRKCAEDAAIILNRFYDDSYDQELDEKPILNKVQVIPSSKDLSWKERPTDWIYDEATCSQFVFLFAEIGKRYLKNVKDYFDLYGKVRNDLEGYTKKSLTVGSVDIGAGTTDVMISAYKYDDAGQCTLTPTPLFWESFNKAGDDLLKELIHQLVIEGQYSPIEKKLKSMGKTVNQIIELNNDFFGGDTGMSFRNRQLRGDFNLQVSVAVVSCYLELLKINEVESKILSFTDIFHDNFPAEDVLIHFKQHFEFDLESLQWQYEKKIVSAIIEKTFDALVGKISTLLYTYGCDIVLLSGRPSSLKPLNNLFLKYYAISPNRLKTMNDYRVGRWYPEDKRYKFLDGNGFFLNPKSIVTTGAMIGNLASNGGLEGFTLDLVELTEKLLPTTEYFGKLNDQTLEFSDILLSPEKNTESVLVSSLPLRIGARQLSTKSYPSRPFYKLEFNTEKIESKIRGRSDNEFDLNAIKIEADYEIKKIRSKMPLKVVIERDYFEDKEMLRIESVTDKHGNDISKNFFNLQIQSLSEAEKYWLDSGIFSVNTNNSQK